MRLISFKTKTGAPALGLRIGDEVMDLAPVGLPSTLDQMLRLGDPAFEAARAAVAKAGPRLALTEIEHLPPLTAPGKAFAIGLNYIDHAAESNFERPRYPVIFQRYPSSWVAHGQALVRPCVSEQFDYEAELVAVIGKAGRYIDPSRAIEHVAGWSLFNDGSVRDHQFRSNQWMMGKNFDASGSFGPEFITADEVPLGAKGLQLQCRLNGKTLQNANTRDMIFDVATLVAACSEATLLQPGDMIITGTPSGVGLARKPQVWMKPGDICEVEVEGIGVLRNPVIDESWPDQGAR